MTSPPPNSEAPAAPPSQCSTSSGGGGICSLLRGPGLVLFVCAVIMVLIVGQWQEATQRATEEARKREAAEAALAEAKQDRAATPSEQAQDSLAEAQQEEGDAEQMAELAGELGRALELHIAAAVSQLRERQLTALERGELQTATATALDAGTLKLEHHLTAFDALTRWYALRERPVPAELFVQRGVLRSLRSSYLEAQEDYDRALERDPGLASAYLLRGEAFEARDKTDRAREDFDRALELEPTLTHAYFHRGRIHYTGARVKEALADFDRALELHPDFGQARFLRSSIYAVGGEVELAVAELDRVLEVAPEHWQAWASRGTLLRDLGRDDALHSFRQAYRYCDDDEHRAELAESIKQLDGEPPTE